MLVIQIVGRRESTFVGSWSCSYWLVDLSHGLVCGVQDDFWFVVALMLKIHGNQSFLLLYFWCLIYVVLIHVFWHLRLHFLGNHDVENALALYWPFLKQILFLLLLKLLSLLFDNEFVLFDEVFSIETRRFVKLLVVEQVFDVYHGGRNWLHPDSGFLVFKLLWTQRDIEGLGMALFFRHLWAGYLPRLGNHSGRLSRSWIEKEWEVFLRLGVAAMVFCHRIIQWIRRILRKDLPPWFLALPIPWANVSHLIIFMRVLTGANMHRIPIFSLKIFWGTVHSWS